MRLSALAARRLQVAAQGLDRRAQRRARKADVLAAIRRMGVLQIDTISVVARSPYFVLYSRLGHYAPRWLDELLAAGALFEYWAHEASLLPREDYALMRHRMLDPRSMGWKYPSAWVDQHADELARVIAFVRERGPVRSSDFNGSSRPTTGWWGWKPEKRALETLFTTGELMVARRQSFQRVYDLRERVHPQWSDDALPPKQETERALILKAVCALGITTARWVADYYRMDRRGTPARVHELAAAGELMETQVDGWNDVAYIHPDHAENAACAADGKLRATLTTLLSPFDPLVWDRARASAVFGFDYRIECYTPEPKRRYGYYVLPVLRRGELVARLDAKAHRDRGVFEIKSFYLEPHVAMSDALLADVAGAIVEAARWHDTPEVRISKTEPRSVMRALQTMLHA